MAIKHLVTRGFGNGNGAGTFNGTIAFVVRRGYSGNILPPVKILTLPTHSLILALPTKSLELTLPTQSLVLTLPQD